MIETGEAWERGYNLCATLYHNHPDILVVFPVLSQHIIYSKHHTVSAQFTSISFRNLARTNIIYLPKMSSIENMQVFFFVDSSENETSLICFTEDCVLVLNSAYGN